MVNKNQFEKMLFQTGLLFITRRINWQEQYFLSDFYNRVAQFDKYIILNIGKWIMGLWRSDYNAVRNLWLIEIK